MSRQQVAERKATKGQSAVQITTWHDSVSDKDEYDMGASNCAAAMCMRCMCMRNSAYLTEARERDRRKGNLSTRNNNNLQDSVSDKDEYDMGASNCAAAVVVYVVVYAVVHAVVHAVYKRWRKKAASSAQKHNAVATSMKHNRTSKVRAANRVADSRQHAQRSRCDIVHSTCKSRHFDDKRWRKKAASSAQKHNAVATSLQRYDALMLRRYDALTLRRFDAMTL
jgi:hypothetical protein